MRVLLAVLVVALFATPAFAGGHNNKQDKFENKINGVNNQLFRTFITPSDNRTKQIDQLEVDQANNLYGLNQLNNH